MGLYGNKFIILDEHVRFITEAYFGKLPFLLEVEKAVHELRKPENLNRFKDLNASAPVQRINRLMEQGFGMEVFSFQIEHNDVINAYTSPVAIRYDIALNANIDQMVYVTQSEGYRFKPNNNICIICTMYMGLLNSNLTDAEIVAVMLHEIGHNFADAIYKDIRLDNKEFAKSIYQTYITMAIMQAFTLHFGNAINIINQWSKKNNNSANLAKKYKKLKYNPIRGIGKAIGSKVHDFKDFCREVVDRYFGYNKLKRIVDQYEIYGVDRDVKKSLDRQNELIADKFAGIYGYGPEQGSALMKMDDIKSKASKFVDKLPGGKDRNNRYNQVVMSLDKYDEHPHIIQRINAEINVLKYELNKGCDPKYEAMIKYQIAQLEQLKITATTIVKDFNQNQKAKALYNAYINQQEPDAVDAEIEDRINDALDALLVRGES
jgi:hypothetical protein